MSAARRLIREVASVARVCGVATAARFAMAIAASLPEILRVKSLAPADAAMRRRNGYLHARVGDARLTLPWRAFSSVRELYGRAVYFPKPEFGIRPGDVVLDLGCNEGLFSLLAAASGASVTGVDAQGGFARDFSEHMTRNRCGERAAFVHAIIGGSAGLFRDPETLRAGSAYTDAPQVRSMEELTAPLPRIDFLKVDVEGSEFAIFRGDQPWIAKVRKIAMEVHPEHGRPADIADWLAAAGFNVFATGQGYIYAQRMALDSAERRHAA